MWIWIALAVMTGSAVMAVLWPLSGRAARASGAGDDVAFYRDQIAEIDRDAARGLLSAEDAESARAEAGRRLLRAGQAGGALEPSTGEPALRRRRAASALALSVVPIVGLGLYGVVGAPELAVAPERAAAASPDAEVATALARMEAHLEAAPDDARGWAIVSPIYLRLGRFADAARGFEALLRLQGPSAELYADLGEALVAGAGGVVGEGARAAFDRALALDPAAPRAAFYRALATEQDGDRRAASAAYRALLAAAPADAPWRPVVAARLAALDGAPAMPVAAVAPGEVTPEILAMVSGLDSRLQAGGGSEAEWTRLVRSYAVLGQAGEARDRLRRARAALAAEAGAGERLDRLSHDLGLDRVTASR